jgi:hypothetical protein
MMAFKRGGIDKISSVVCCLLLKQPLDHIHQFFEAERFVQIFDQTGWLDTDSAGRPRPSSTPGNTGH